MKIRGKWSLAGVPDHGWGCIDVEDLGEERIVCEMCESQQIRYVHHMAHPEYPDVLKVGRSCAANMEEDVSAAKKREKTLEKRVGWVRGWTLRPMREGGFYKKVSGGWVVEVYMRDQRWTVTIRTPKEFYQAKDSFETIADAQLYSFHHYLQCLYFLPCIEKREIKVR